MQQERQQGNQILMVYERGQGNKLPQGTKGQSEAGPVLLPTCTLPHLDGDLVAGLDIADVHLKVGHGQHVLGGLRREEGEGMRCLGGWVSGWGGG